MMKKIWIIGVLFLLIGCKKAPKLDQYDQMSKEIVDQLQLNDILMLQEDRIGKGIFYLKDEDVVGLSVYLSKQDKADLVAVIETKNVEACKESILRYLHEQKLKIQNLYPLEVFKLDHPILVDHNGIVVAVVCEDMENAMKIVDDVLGK